LGDGQLVDEYKCYKQTQETPGWERAIKWALISAVTLTICYKILQVQSNFNFNFTDLLSLLLAIFSIWLSAQFYFKANETSNQFYDRVFQFTKDASVVLGKIEAEFSEQLRNLGTNLSDVRNQLGNLTPEKIELKQQELQSAETSAEMDKDNLIQELKEKAKRGEELDQTLSRLDEKEKEIRKLAIKQSHLEQALKEALLYRELDSLSPQQRRFMQAFAQKIGKETLSTGDSDAIQALVPISPALARLMNGTGLLLENGKLTGKGVKMFQLLGQKLKAEE
jgi:hypothetical protein